jgi:hypothetical protein
MWLKDILADRQALITVQTIEQGAETERFIYYGVAPGGIPTQLPPPPTDPGADYHVGLEFIIILLGSVALFSATLAVAVVRHRLCRKREPGTADDDDGRRARTKPTAPFERIV